MSKLKTKRSAAKRFKVTGSGKFMAHRSGKRHLLTSKPRKRKRALRKDFVVSETISCTMKRMMPYL